jgi:uncharacterized membrane protein YfcA
MWFFAAFAIAGGAAQFVDGTLGMGFGVTSATILLWMGVSAAAASAATHIAKLPTTFVSGLTHWRQGNVDTGTLLRVAVPGAIAAFIGAVVLVNLSLETAKGWMAGLLFFFGLVILVRFGFNRRLIPAPKGGHTAWWLSPLGSLGGFTDSMGGGGWGPVVTPSVMTVTNHEPRKVVGTVNAAEFFVALSASLGFLTGADQIDENMPWLAVGGLILGGVIVAPFAARLAGRLPHHVMGTAVGGLMLIVNASTIGKLVGVPMSVGVPLTLLVIVVTAVIGRRAYLRYDRVERDEREHRGEPTPAALERLP